MSSVSPGNPADGLAPEGGRLMTGFRGDQGSTGTWGRLSEHFFLGGCAEVGGGPHWWLVHLLLRVLVGREGLVLSLFFWLLCGRKPCYEARYGNTSCCSWKNHQIAWSGPTFLIAAGQVEWREAKTQKVEAVCQVSWRARIQIQVFQQPCPVLFASQHQCPGRKIPSDSKVYHLSS